MNSNRDIVYLFKSKIKEIYQEQYISNRAALADLKSIANLLIKREIDNRRLRDIDSIYTTIPCLEMISVPLAECCSYTSPCTIRRSKYPLPKTGESIWGYIIEGVWSVDGKVQFNKGSAQKYANLLDLSNKIDMFWIQNNYLYVTDKDIELLKTRLYLEDFEIDPKLLKCSGDYEDLACRNPLDEPFKCPGYLIQNVLDIAVKQYLSETKPVQPDITDNDTQIPN